MTLLLSLAAAVTVCLAIAGGRASLGTGFIWLAQSTRFRGGVSLLSATPVVERGLLRVGALPARYEVEPGVSLRLDPLDFVQRRILYYEWEPEVWQAIRGGLRPGGVMVDVGAHIGYYSLKAARVVGPGGRVVAVEPNPPTLELLRENVSASVAANVAVAPVACAEREGTLLLYAGPRANIGVASLAEANAAAFQEHDKPQSYSVRVRPLDDIVEESGLERLDVLKIDTEGAEVRVLEGARRTLSRFHPRIVIEVIPEQLAAMGASVEQLHALLRGAGYAMVRQVDETNEEWVAGVA